MLQVREPGTRRGGRQRIQHKMEAPRRGNGRGRHRRQTHLESRVREEENKDAQQAEGGRGGTGPSRGRRCWVGTWTRPRTKNGRVLVDSMTTKDGEFGDVSVVSLGGWGGAGGGRGKRRAKAAGVEGTGGRKAEGRRTVISGRRPCSQTRTGPWTVDLGEAVGQWAGQCSGSVAGKWVGVAPPSPKLSRNQDDGLLLLSVFPPRSGRVRAGMGLGAHRP